MYHLVLISQRPLSNFINLIHRWIEDKLEDIPVTHSVLQSAAMNLLILMPFEERVRFANKIHEGIMSAIDKKPIGDLVFVKQSLIKFITDPNEALKLVDSGLFDEKQWDTL